MATITAKKASKQRSTQELETIEGYSSEPFFIRDTVQIVTDFDSIIIAADGTQFAEITAYEANKVDTYDYMAQCNILAGDAFEKIDDPLTSPNGFKSVTLGVAGAIRINR
jgi:hypothetical protein